LQVLHLPVGIHSDRFKCRAQDNMHFAVNLDGEQFVAVEWDGG
jgi:hypothetical protein